MRQRSFIKKINFRKWLDGFILAAKGIMLATKEKRFWLGFMPAFMFFGTLINLLAGGTSKFQLMGAVGLAGSMKIIWAALMGTFGVNMIFMEWLPVFSLATMQGLLIGLIVLLWDRKWIRFRHRTNARASANGEEKTSFNSINVERAGIITGLIALGAGCPTCGTTLITPLLGAIFSSGGMAVAGAFSGAMTVAAVVVAVFSLRRLGEETYVIMVNERYMRKKEEREKGA